MTLFAGMATVGYMDAEAGASKRMLSVVDAPHHFELKHYHDSHIDLASKTSGSVSEFYADDKVCVLAGGLVENSPELLGIPADRSNTGRILADAYKKWGESLVDHIFGEFTFAIWDKQNRSLFCGRDRFGKMPFSYEATDDGILFSTDFIAVAMGQSSVPIVNSSWIVGYIKDSVLDQECTPFERIKKLPPACVMTWCNGDLVVRQYWSFDDIGPCFESLDASVLLSHLEHSVEHRMLGSNNVAMLSGGLDSTSIFVLARDLQNKKSQKPISSVSLVFDDLLEEDERPFIDCILGQGEADPHFVNAQEYDVISAIDRLVRIQGGPYAGIGAPILVQAIDRLEYLGFESVLDGHGGDEVISSPGAMRHFELANEGKWITLISEMRQLLRHSEIGLSEMVGAFASHYGAKGRGVSARLVRKFYWKLKALNKAEPTTSLLNPDWNTHDSASLADRIAKKWLGTSHENERSYQQFVLSGPLQSDAFERLHRLYRSRGIRAEFPFWDHKVVSYCLRVPSDQKLRNGVPRSLIRSAMGRRLPPMIANRISKFDFSDAHIRSYQSSIQKIQEYASSPGHVAFDYVDHSVFSSAVLNLQHERIQIRKEAHRKVWTTLNLMLWFDMIAQFEPLQKAD